MSSILLICYLFASYKRPNPSASDTKSRSHSANINMKLGLNHIFSVEPLKICVNEDESPRAPNIDECEILIKKLYDLYKQQKQQVCIYIYNV